MGAVALADRIIRQGLRVKSTAPSCSWSPLRSAFAGFRFPAEVIVVAVRWYLRYGLSYRDVEELLAERGIEVDHVTVYRWVQRFAPLLADAARFARHSPGDRWFVDETYVKVTGPADTPSAAGHHEGSHAPQPCRRAAAAWSGARRVAATSAAFHH